jgi:hypothetical protein
MFRNPLSAILSTILLAGAIARPLEADPLADLAKYSVFSSVDLSSLSGGAVQAVRGPNLGNARDVSIQAVYLIHAPVARALQLHQQWDAGKHPELKVYVHHDFSTHPTLADFTQSIPGNGAVRKLTEATGKLPDLEDLQLSKAEAVGFKKTGGGGAYPAPVQAFWSQVLFHRASDFLQHGLSGQPPYDTADGSARVSEEISRLLSEQPKVRAAFGPIISHSPLWGGLGSAPLMPYWELFDVESQAAFNLGAATSVMTGDSAQMVDFQYYASGGYFAYITLYQMWPVTVNGKPATLVWRVDSMSSQELSDLAPFDRMASGVAMSKDILRIINFFQKDVGR